MREVSAPARAAPPSPAASPAPSASRGPRPCSPPPSGPSSRERPAAHPDRSHKPLAAVWPGEKRRRVSEKVGSERREQHDGCNLRQAAVHGHPPAKDALLANRLVRANLAHRSLTTSSSPTASLSSYSTPARRPTSGTPSSGTKRRAPPGAPA